MSWSEMWHLWQFKEPPKPSFNVKPSQQLIYFDEHQGKRTAWLGQWGITRRGSTIINARSETIDALPTFRDAFVSHRIVVPVNGWYEWASGNRPHHFATTDEVALFAGIAIDGHVIIATTTPNADAGRVHNRMPAILRPEQVSTWLTGSPDGAKALLGPWHGRLEIFEVGRNVNRAANTGPECLNPPTGQIALF